MAKSREKSLNKPDGAPLTRTILLFKSHHGSNGVATHQQHQNPDIQTHEPNPAETPSPVVDEMRCSGKANQI